MKRVFLIIIMLCGGIISMLNMNKEATPRENTVNKQSGKTNVMPEFSTYYYCLLKRGPNWTAESTPEHERLQAQHAAFIQNLMVEGKIIVAGPFADGDDARGLAVFRANSLPEAKSFIETDPKVQAGHLTLEWFTWLVPKDLLPEQTYLNKVKTGRALNFEATLNLSPPEVFLLWSTSAGVKKFFAPDAKVDPAFGGRYEIIFDPESDPDGKSAGTHGARILRYEKDKALAFEWTMPPFAPELNTKPLPTWIELQFEAVAGHSGKTRISIAHYGFGNGENWDKSYKFFRDSSWPAVVKRLKQYCNDKIDPWKSMR